MIDENRYFVEEMADETIVFDRSNGRCHCLNDTAAKVWRLTEGEGLEKAEVVARLSKETGSDVDDSVVDLALARLRSAGASGTCGGPSLPPQDRLWRRASCHGDRRPRRGRAHPVPRIAFG